MDGDLEEEETPENVAVLQNLTTNRSVLLPESTIIEQETTAESDDYDLEHF